MQDFLRVVMPWGAVIAIFFAAGAISDDRAAKRFDFSFGLPYSRESYFFSKYLHRLLWLAVVCFVPLVFGVLWEEVKGEAMDWRLFLWNVAIFALWIFGFYTITFFLSLLSAYPLQELVRMLVYSGPVYAGVPIYAAVFIAAAFPDLTAGIHDLDVLWSIGMSLIAAALGMLGILSLFAGYQILLRKDWVG